MLQRTRSLLLSRLFLGSKQQAFRRLCLPQVSSNPPQTWPRYRYFYVYKQRMRETWCHSGIDLGGDGIENMVCCYKQRGNLAGKSVQTSLLTQVKIGTSALCARPRRTPNSILLTPPLSRSTRETVRIGPIWDRPSTDSRGSFSSCNYGKSHVFSFFLYVHTYVLQISVRPREIIF